MVLRRTGRPKRSVKPRDSFRGRTDAQSKRRSSLRPRFAGCRSPVPCSRWQERFAFTAICLGFSVIALDLLAVNVALPSIHRDLGGPLSGLQWVIDGYTVAYASLLLTAGALGDRLGQRRVFLGGMALFGVASPLCSLAPSLTVLIAARVLQGCGAAILLPSSFGLVASTYRDPVRRTRALGVWSAAGSIAGLTGPAIGGVLTAALGWQSIFWINVPVVMVCFAFGWRTIGETPVRRERKVDLPGQVLVIGAVGLLTLALIESGHLGWGSALVLVALVCGLVTGAAFVAVERRSAEPMLPLGLLQRPRVATATLVSTASMFSTIGVLFALSLFLQDVRDFSPLTSGLAFMPLNAVGVPGTLLAGRWTARSGPRAPMTTGMCISAVGAAMMAFAATSGAPFWIIAVALAVLGAGTALTVPASMAAVSVGVPAEQVGLAGGMINSSRQCGAAFGIAVLGSILASSGSDRFRLAFLVAAAMFAVGAVIAVAFLRGRLETPPVGVGADRSAAPPPATRPFAAPGH